MDRELVYMEYEWNRIKSEDELYRWRMVNGDADVIFPELLAFNLNWFHSSRKQTHSHSHTNNTIVHSTISFTTQSFHTNQKSWFIFHSFWPVLKSWQPYYIRFNRLILSILFLFYEWAHLFRSYEFNTWNEWMNGRNFSIKDCKRKRCSSKSY